MPPADQEMFSAASSVHTDKKYPAPQTPNVPCQYKHNHCGFPLKIEKKVGAKCVQVKVWMA